MSKGKQRAQARKAALLSLGRQLARRASSQCELCGTASGCSPTEITPLPEEPLLSRSLLLCPACVELCTKPASKIQLSQVRFLAEKIWSEVVPVQVTAIRIAQKLPSYQQALEELYLSEEVEQLLAE